MSPTMVEVSSATDTKKDKTILLHAKMGERRVTSHRYNSSLALGAPFITCCLRVDPSVSPPAQMIFSLQLCNIVHLCSLHQIFYFLSPSLFYSLHAYLILYPLNVPLCFFHLYLRTNWHLYHLAKLYCHSGNEYFSNCHFFIFYFYWYFFTSSLQHRRWPLPPVRQERRKQIRVKSSPKLSVSVSVKEQEVQIFGRTDEGKEDEHLDQHFDTEEEEKHWQDP